MSGRFEAVVEAAVRLNRVTTWNDEHPENPYADADDEYSTELLVRAINQWLDHMAPLMFIETACTHEFEGATCGICWENVQRICRLLKKEVLPDGSD